MQLRQSMRRAAKMRLALAGASGSGKTYSSLLIAYGMTGGIAAAYYGIPDWMVEKAVKYLPNDMIEIINRFDGRELKKS